ncbi:hypothetical protein CBL_08176 [Carabus blaptoides fortunei]
MAKNVAFAFKNSLLSTVYFTNVPKYGTFIVHPVRQLYTQTALGLENYIHSRQKVKSQFTTMSEKFKAKMTEYTSNEQNTHMIFTEDLKNMIHLAESNEEDVSLVIKMMKKFNQQNKELRFGNFVFGPVVMRMFYFLNEPDAALKCFKTPELQGFFDQLMSYQLLLDLLYENARYDDVIETFELIKSKQIQGTKYPKNIVVLTMAACYKQNTPKSIDYALSLWTELNSVGHLPMRRASTFCAGLALNQGKYDAALEIVSTAKKQNYMTVRNIKVAALAQLGRLDDALQILKSVLEIDDPNNVKHTFSKEVIELVSSAVEKQNKAELKQEYERLEKYLNEQGHITQITLDSQLCSEITSVPINSNNNRQPQGKTIPRYQYQGNTSKNYQVYNQRPGLRDMH